MMQGSNYAGYYAPHDQQQQQYHARGQTHSQYSNPTATRVSAPTQYNRLSGQSQEPNGNNPNLSERYTYNTQTTDGYGAYDRSNFDNHANLALNRNMQYRSSSSGSNQAQYQGLQAQGTSDYSAQQTRPELVNGIPANYTTSSSRPMHRPTSSTVAAHRQTQRASSPQWQQAQSQSQRLASPHWPQAHPTSYERERTSSTLNPSQNRVANQDLNLHRLNGGHQWSSSEPAATTVDPSAVYDSSHEYRRRAEVEAAKKAAEVVRVADENHNAEAARIAEEIRKVEEATNDAAVQARQRESKSKGAKTAKTVKSDGTKSSRKKETSKTKESNVKNSTHVPVEPMIPMPASSPTDSNNIDLEEQMREMFKKMREFNQQDPELLSKLWQQERDAHMAKEAAKPKDSTLQPQETQAQIPVEYQAATHQVSSANTMPSASQQAKGPVATTSTPVTSVAQPPKPVPQKGGAMWTADKKNELAAAAAEIINRANKGRSLSASEISTILDLKPSYLEFCQKLEAQGFKFDRGQVAKALISAVPDGIKDANSATSVISETSTAGKYTTSAMSMHSPSLSTPADAEQRLMNAGSLVTATKAKAVPKKTPEAGKNNRGRLAEESSRPLVVDPQLEGLDAVKEFVDGAWIPRSQTQTQSLPQTQISSAKPAKDRKSIKVPSRSSLPPKPVTKQDLARKRTFAELIDLTHHGDSSDDESRFPLPKKQQTCDLDLSKLPTPAPTLADTSPHLPMKQPLPVPPQPLTVSPLPTTAAPPSSNFVPQDLVPRAKQANPMQPEQPAVTMVPPDHPTRKVKMISFLDKHKAIRRSTYNSKTIARDVLIACGRHPDMRHLNAHLELLKSAFLEIDNNSDLSTFRWDVADPGGPAPGSGALKSTNQSPTFIDEAHADDEDSDNDSILGNAGTGVRSAATQALVMRQGLGVDGDVEIISSIPASRPRGKSGLRRGRPSRQSVPGVRVRTEHGDSTPPRRSEGLASSQAASSTTPLTYREIRTQAEAEQRARGQEPARSRGRPVGWRKWMQKGGAPSKPPTATPNKQPSPEPTYEVYKCEWKSCGAELHNLVTLRRHLHKVHGKPNSGGTFRCEWFQCGKVKTTTDEITHRTMAKFVAEDFISSELWKAHIEKKHLSPIAWKLGDGPKGGLSDNYESEVSESYMSDREGRRVTPKVVVPQQAESTPGANANPRPKVRAADEEAEAEQQAERNRKRDIGPAVDRQGATLANSKRRQGFLDDEDIAEVIDEDD